MLSRGRIGNNPVKPASTLRDFAAGETSGDPWMAGRPAIAVRLSIIRSIRDPPLKNVRAAWQPFEEPVALAPKDFAPGSQLRNACCEIFVS
jgi:hypothetical protein